jgi:hypothetical protein
MSLLEMLRLALQLVAVIAPIVSQIGKDGNEQVVPGKLPEEAKVILDTLATKAPSAQ